MSAHPGLPHRFSIRCDECGAAGLLNVTLHATDEAVVVESGFPPDGHHERVSPCCDDEARRYLDAEARTSTWTDHRRGER